MQLADTCDESPCRCTNLALCWMKQAIFVLSAVSSNFKCAGTDTLCMLVLDLSKHVVQNQCDSLVILLLVEVH